MRRSRDFLVVVTVLMAVMLWPAIVSAQYYRAACAECQPIVFQLEDLERKLEEANRNYYRELGESMSLMQQNTADRITADMVAREFSAERAAKAQQDAAARIAAREPALKEHEARAEHFSRLQSAIRGEIAGLRIDLDLCNLRCKSPGTPPPPIGTTGPQPPVTPPAPANDTAVPVPECPSCKDLATRLNNLLQQRRGARGTLQTVINSRGAFERDIAEREAELKKLVAGRQNPNRADDGELSVQDRIDDAREQLQEVPKYQEFWEAEIKRLDAEIAPLQSEYERCNKACRPNTQTGSLFNPKTLFLAGGAVVGGLLVATSGGDTPTTVASPPPAAPTPVAQQPQPQPQPTQPPPPVAQPTIAGVADCTRCEIMDDSGRHNVVINLCPQLTGGFEIAVASITIRHAAPFVDLVGAQYDQASGVFRGTTRGTVAGFPNVGIAVDGTANAATGEIRFLYTMGTGGELPGGRSITYAITLQKRR